MIFSPAGDCWTSWTEPWGLKRVRRHVSIVGVEGEKEWERRVTSSKRDMERDCRW